MSQLQEDVKTLEGWGLRPIAETYEAMAKLLTEIRNDGIFFRGYKDRTNEILLRFEPERRLRPGQPH